VEVDDDFLLLDHWLLSFILDIIQACSPDKCEGSSVIADVAEAVIGQDIIGLLLRFTDFFKSLESIKESSLHSIVKDTEVVVVVAGVVETRGIRCLGCSWGFGKGLVRLKKDGTLEGWKKLATSL
jgi:hypothetical protein